MIDSMIMLSSMRLRNTCLLVMLLFAQACCLACQHPLVTFPLLQAGTLCVQHHLLLFVSQRIFAISLA